MFYTLTANPAVDMTVSCNGLVPNENVRSGSASYTPNGKGLDVSYAFKKFGVDSVALGFFAGFTGKFIVEETMNMGCLCRPVWVDGITMMARTSTASLTPVLLSPLRTSKSSTRSWTPPATSIVWSFPVPFLPVPPRIFWIRPSTMPRPAAPMSYSTSLALS